MPSAGVHPSPTGTLLVLIATLGGRCYVGMVLHVEIMQNEAERASLTCPSYIGSKIRTCSRCVMLLP